MTQAREYLAQSHRQFATVIAQMLLGSTLLLILISVGFILFQPSLATYVYAFSNIVAFISSLITLRWLNYRAIPQAFLPLISGCLLTITIVGLFLHDLRMIAVASLAIVLVISGITADRRLIAGVMVSCVVVIVLIYAGLPIPDVGQGLARFLSLLAVIVGIAIVMIVWLVLDRLVRIQSSAIELADLRTAETIQALERTNQVRAEVEQRNQEQQRLLEVIQTLELPILNMGQGVLAVPLIGHLDTNRINHIRTNLLQTVSASKAHTVIMDITGVTLMDTGVAQSIIQLGKAVRLLGARTLISGISPVIAQTMVGLGMSLDGLEPVSDLSAAISHDSA